MAHNSTTLIARDPRFLLVTGTSILGKNDFASQFRTRVTRQGGFAPLKPPTGGPPDVHIFSPRFWTYHWGGIHHTKDGICISNGYGDIDILILLYPLSSRRPWPVDPCWSNFLKRIFPCYHSVRYKRHFWAFINSRRGYRLLKNAGNVHVRHYQHVCRLGYNESSYRDSNKDLKGKQMSCHLLY